MFQLPKELIDLVYSFDCTKRENFDKVLGDFKIVFNKYYDVLEYEHKGYISQEDMDYVMSITPSILNLIRNNERFFITNKVIKYNTVIQEYKDNIYSRVEGNTETFVFWKKNLRSTRDMYYTEMKVF